MYYPNVTIHSSAIVDDGAQIGEGSRVWHFVHVCGGAQIGKGVSLGQNVFVGNKVLIGDQCKIQNNVSIYDNITLEDGVFCGPSMVFTNVYNPRSFIERKKEYRNTHVKKGATLGANCTVICGITIGEYAFIGAGAVVNKDVKPYALMMGVPAKQIGWMSAYGEQIPLPIEGEGQYTCPHTGQLYKLLLNTLSTNGDTNCVTDISIPFIDLKTQYQALKPKIQARIDKVLEHGQYIMGPEVKELEDRLATYTGARHCITCASGTEALLISLMALDIKVGDEIITTPFTFVATVEMIVLLGAKPVFVDVEFDTGNIDANLIEAKITSKTKAIIPVSLYGQTADMDAINAIAEKYCNLSVIEDAAQSFGATYKGRKSCNLSTIGCTSFFPSKPLGCYGDGGAIFTNDDVLAQVLREIRVHGQTQRYVHTRVGVGGRMDTLQCAIVLAKLDSFEWEVQQRDEIGQRYNRLLDDAGIPRIHQRPYRKSVYAQYTIMVPEREILQKNLAKAGVPSAVHYPLPVNEQPAYKNFCCPDCTPVAREMAKVVMSLPMSPQLKPQQQRYVLASLLSARHENLK